MNFEESGKSIDARALMVFFMGDLTELAIVALAKAAGCNITSTGENQLVTQIQGVQGHPDGILFDSGKTYLLEVKSMSSYGFKEFERGVLDTGYIYQCNAYMEALNLEQCVIIGLNKDAGVLAEQVLSRNPEVVLDILNRIKDLKTRTKENLPPRPFAPNDKGFYPWNCLYCAYHKICLPSAEKVVVGKAYKLKETKTQKETPHVATPTP